MRLTTVILIASLMQVSASTFGQRITINQQNAPLSMILKEIRKQSGYDIYADSKVISKDQKVSVALSDVSLDEALTATFKNLNVAYKIDGKIISIKRKEEPSLFENLIARFQKINVRGRVVDENGQGLPGANVKVKGTNKSVSTNSDGIFYIPSLDEKATLVISFIGYKTLEIAAKADLGDVRLEIVSGQLEEVTINKGYYNTQQETNTGSVSRISGADIRKQPLSNPLAALEGKLTGVYISQNSGVPGSRVNFNIRGKNSITAGVDPLYVIDGIPYPSQSLQRLVNAAGGDISPFTNIRPENIEEITVLKDADATAIYGSRGANGVVLITTRTGKAGKSRFDVNITRGAGEITRRLELMNTQQYLEMRDEAYKNDNTTPSASQYDVNGTWDRNRYTDWQEVLIGGTANQTTASVNFSGGTEHTQFLIGGSYRKETTVFPGDFNNAIGGINANINHHSENKKFNIVFSTSYTNNSTKIPLADFTSLIFWAPNAPAIYTEEGKINWQDNTFNNPLASTLNTARVNSETVISNVSSSYNFFTGFQAKINAGFTSNNFTELNLTPLSSFIPSSYTPANAASFRLAQTGNNKLTTWIIEPQLNFNRSIGNHSFEALIAATFQENEQKGNTITARGFASDILLENNAAATTVTSTTSYGQYKYNALFARIGYNYSGKYILNFTGRRDGSSRFGPGKKFGNFGSIGAAWIFTKTDFISNHLHFLSFGKLRGSIGITGNDQIGDYQYMDLYLAQTGYFGTGGLLVNKLTNTNYRWETLKKMELALELGFFSNRLKFNAATFRNRTSNQLVGFSLPSIAGFTTVTANFPGVIQNKGIEFELSSQNLNRKNFTWTTTANITIPRNKLVSYPGIESSSFNRTYAVGYPLDMSWRYKYTGVDPNTGLYSFEDFDKNGTINSTTDRYPVENIRNFFGGLENSFTYKGISLEIFFQFVKQDGSKAIGSIDPGTFFSRGATANTLVGYLDRWQKVGDQAQNPKFTTTGTTAQFSNYGGSDARIVDASFIRLRNVALSWQLPAAWLNKVRFNSARIFMQGQNLLTVTRFDGMDPENPSPAILLPPLRMVTAGINVSL